MKSKRMKKRREAFHQDKNDDSEEGPNREHKKQDNTVDVFILVGS